MRRGLRTWRPALRIARRDAWQHKGRSAVVLLMVALPVLGVVGLDALFRTADVSAVEGLGRRIGSSDALVTWTGAKNLKQDPTDLAYSSDAPSDVNPDPGDPGPEKALRRLLPGGSRLLPMVQGSTVVRTDLGRSSVRSSVSSRESPSRTR